MTRYFFKWYLGSKVHVIELKNDTQKVQLSVMGDKFGYPIKLAKEYRDTELESQGWKRMAVVNGGLFFPYGGVIYAEGIEKCYGVVNELDDASLDNCMSMGTFGGVPIVASQAYIKKNIDLYRGALTGAFGLLNNGVVDTRGKDKHLAIFNAKSGRTIVGKKPDGTIVIASFYGTTGVSGLTGTQTVSLAKSLGMNNAICLDGGGSVSMEYDGMSKVSTTRKVKNAIGVYVK